MTDARAIETYVEVLTYVPTETREIEAYAEVLSLLSNPTGTAPVGVGSSSAAEATGAVTTTGSAPVSVASSSQVSAADPITTGSAPLGVGSTGTAKPPRRSIEYVTCNVGYEDTSTPKNSWYVYQNVSVEVVRDQRDASYLYQNVLGRSWYGAPPYVLLTDEDVSGGILTETGGGIGAIYGPYTVPEGYRVGAVKVWAQVKSGTDQGEDASWKLEDIGDIVNGAVLSVTHEASHGRIGPNEEGLLANQWTPWIDEQALDEDQTITLLNVLASGQVALTFNPGGALRTVSSVRLILTLTKQGVLES